jgi:hypothetical protein
MDAAAAYEACMHQCDGGMDISTQEATARGCDTLSKLLKDKTEKSA